MVRKDEGSFMRLICSVVKCGRPNGVIYWIENDASVNKTCGPTVPPVETILETNVTESDHEKLYTCVADNGIMQQNKSVTLLVNCKYVFLQCQVCVCYHMILEYAYD